MDFTKLIDELEDIIEESSKVPFSSKCMVDKEELLDIVEQIRLSYPEELKQATWVKKERERILQDAQKEANAITENAKAKVVSMVNDSEIVRLSKEKAAQIVKEGEEHKSSLIKEAKLQIEEMKNANNEEIKSIQLGAAKYIDSALDAAEAQTEKSVEVLAKSIDILNRHYDELREVYDNVSKNRKAFKENNSL